MVYGQSPSINYIILDFYLYLEKVIEVMVLAQKNPIKFRILIRFALMQNKLLGSSYLKGKF